MTSPSAPDLPLCDERLARLRAPLLAELRPDRRPARRARGRLAGLAVVTCVLVVGAASAALLLRAPSPALAVARSDGWIELRIADASAGSAELTRALQAAGIPGEVRVIPVPEELVGTWAAIAEQADPPGVAPGGAATGPTGDETVRLDRIDYGRDLLRLPAAELRETTGWFVLYAGRATRRGEEPAFDGARFTGPGLPG